MKKIALEAGHGLKTAGKQTPNGIKEWELSDKVRDRVVALLKDYDVTFVFPDNNEGNVDESLSSRRSMYLNAGVDAMVSLHFNAFTGDWNKATGVEVFVDKKYTSKDMALAKAIYKNLPNYMGLKGRGIKKENWLVINQNKIPAVLVEGGFMDSTIDYPIITSVKGQDAYARAVAEGLIAFLGLKKKVVNVKKGYTGTFPSLGLKGYLKQGDKGTNVKRLQEFLNWCINAKLSVDGSFGPATLAAVKSYQKKYILTVDGFFGPACLKKAKTIKK